MLRPSKRTARIEARNAGARAGAQDVPWRRLAHLWALATSCVALVASWSAGASAADVHVGPAATGVGTGADWSNQAAWSSVALSRGNTYHLASGTYGAKALDTAESGAIFITIKKATTADHGSDAGWDASLGQGVATFDSASLSISTGYWDIDGVAGGGPGAWQSGHGFAFTSPVGTNISYVDVASGVSHVMVRHCAFTQTGDTTTSPVETSGIYDPGELSSSTVEYCAFDNLGGLPFFLRGGSTNVFQYNYLGDICGASVYDQNQHCEGVVIHGMGDIHFRWNYVAECPSSGGFVKNDTPESANVRIYGNTFETGFPINCNTGSCVDWRIFNNTFHSVVGGPFGGDGAVAGLLYYNNVVFDSEIGTGVFGEHGYNWFSRIQANSCDTGATETENITVNYPNDCDRAEETLDPFVDSAAHDPPGWALAAPIAGWDGTDVCALEACSEDTPYDRDAFGATRGADGVWDRGAYEYPPAFGGGGAGGAAGGAGGSPTGGAGGQGGTGHAGAAGGGAAAPSSEPSDEGGCGCRTTSTGRPPLPLAFLAPLVMLVASRRRLDLVRQPLQHWHRSSHAAHPRSHARRIRDGSTQHHGVLQERRRRHRWALVQFGQRP